ncbi:MAG: hypothetical protein AAGF01_17205 [Cyanobacteria bacterium P01_G01_bin.38]
MQSEIRNLIPSWEGQRGELTVSASDRNPPRLSGTPPKEGIKLNTLLNPYSLESFFKEINLLVRAEEGGPLTGAI